MLKPLFTHKCTEKYGKVALGDTDIVLTDAEHIRSWERLKSDGILEPGLARAMWPDLPGYGLPFLQARGLTFPLEGDGANGLVVLLRLKTERPSSTGNDLDAYSLERTPMLEACWDMFLGVTPGAVERFLTRCCTLGPVRAFWRFGVRVTGKMGGDDFALLAQYSHGSKQLRIDVYGKINTAAPWAASGFGLSAATEMVQEFPGLRCRAHVKCPDHDIHMQIDTKRRLEYLQGRMIAEGRHCSLFARGVNCSQCHPETGGLGAAAVELLRAVDIAEGRGKDFSVAYGIYTIW